MAWSALDLFLKTNIDKVLRLREHRNEAGGCPALWPRRGHADLNPHPREELSSSGPQTTTRPVTRRQTQQSPPKLQAQGAVKAEDGPAA